MASTSNNTSSLMQGLDSKSRALIGKIVGHLKSKGNFDELRRDCLEELDKMESFRQLNQRVESYVATFLSKQEWSDTLSKNQMRDNLRKHVCASETLKTGADRLVTQVIEKRSRAFQTRLEGIVQNFIYMDKERERQERQARYQGRNTYNQETTSKYEQASSSEKTSGISDVNDIISQIEHQEVEPTNKGDSSASVKSETSSQQSTKSDSGVQLKPEQFKHEKKADVASPSDSSKNTPPPKSNFTKRSNPSKRVIPKIGASPIPPSPSEKPTDLSKTKLPKANHLSTTETSQQKLVYEEQHVDTTKKIDTPSHKPDVAKVVAVSMETEKSLQDSDTNKDNESTRMKVDDGQNIDTMKDNICTNTIVADKEQKKEPSITAENQDIQSTEIIDSIGIQQKEPHKAENLEIKDRYNYDQIDTKNNEDGSESDIDDSVSDVSSVHTSDLSSFDGEVSDDEHSEEEGKQNLKDEKSTEKRFSNQKDKMASVKKSGKVRSKHQITRDGSQPSKRGRPKKDQARGRTMVEGKPTQRHSKSRRHGDHGSKDGIQVRDKSKRPIKKKRCYSPSSEGTREVCLPSKRSRVNSRD